mgnify:CR=1 FL=1
MLHIFNLKYFRFLYICTFFFDIIILYCYYPSTISLGLLGKLFNVKIVEDLQDLAKPKWNDLFKHGLNFALQQNLGFVLMLISKIISDIILIPTNKISNEKLENDDIILLIDDCIYSGTQMSNSITFNSMVFTENKLKLNICVLVPFITEMGKLTIERGMRLNTTLDECSFKIFHNKLIKETTNSILTTDEIIQMDNFYNKYETFNNRYLIYFDHKLADIVSTITAFYSGIVPNAKNRYYLKKENKKL